MSDKKKAIRKAFRDACFKRDGFRCAKCPFKSSKDNAENELDAHHVTNRTLMVNGGYVKENGISLCDSCHQKAEDYFLNIHHPGYSPEDLYKAIGSTYEKAVAASHKLV